MTDPSPSSSSSLQVTDLEGVYRAVHTLYSMDPSIPVTEKQAASMWLNEFQKSVHAWEIADQLLHRKTDLESCYFGAHTLRTKIQSSFHELPVDAHVPLRDSLLQHISAIDGTTDHIIVTQLCLAVTHLILQATSWADPIGHLLNTFGVDPSHWWPVLEILTLLPEEVHSRKLQLGENRRHQITSILEGVAPTILSFLKQSLNVCLHTPPTAGVMPVEMCLIGIVRCFGSWVLINPECFFTSRDAGAMEVMRFAVDSLRDIKCSAKLHNAATDTLCAVAEVVPDMDVSSNNNANELQQFQLTFHTAIMTFKDPYSYAVADEDQDKVLNYCRIFTEYGENMVPYMLRSSRDRHYSIEVIDSILDCLGHHDYEVAENTFSFWYRLDEDLYHAHDETLNQLFRPHAARLILSLHKQCEIDPDHEGPLNPNEEFYEFRKKAAEIVEDSVFIVGHASAFNKMAEMFLTEGSWESKEAALFLLYHITKTLDPDETQVTLVKSFLDHVLAIGPTDWRHICMKLSAIRFLGGLSSWISRHPDDTLEKTLNFLVSSLPIPECSNVSAVALQSICEQCADHLASRYIDNLLGIVTEMDRYNVCNEAVVGLLKGVGHVVGSLPRDRLSTVIRQICWAQIQPLKELCESDAPYMKGTKTDPALWVDRLAALFRNSAAGAKNELVGEHPCSVAICQDLWPVISRVMDKYQADPRIMERVCRCIRYSVRCVGKHSHPFLQPLVLQLVGIYNVHHHSCLLYLGSILVDEYGSEPQCIEGLLQMLSAFLAPTFALLNEPSGFRNHPDTVDDFFRLCARYLQRCPIALLKSEVIVPMVQCATQATHLDHREANMSVMKFLYDLVHSARRHKDAQDFPERQMLVKGLMNQTAGHLMYTIIYGVIFALPTYTVNDIAELIYEIKEVMPEESSKWLEEALKRLPSQTPAGVQTATLEQLEFFHKQTLSSRSPKELGREMKEFCRYYR